LGRFDTRTAAFGNCAGEGASSAAGGNPCLGVEKQRCRSTVENVKIAVVIPYFQRDPGILRRSILSALRQDDVEHPSIIVVDDSSPVPASSELADPAFGASGKITVISRANGGPGAARNTGLDAVPDQFDLVAFLDSDDEWAPDHLRNALEAFRAGCDFYFSDHLDYSGETTRFGRSQARGTFRIDDHPRIRPDSPLHWFSGDFVDQLIREFVIGTPTVVVRRSFLGRNRFPTNFRRAGEDHLLWLKLAASGAKVAFSDRVECRAGRGVNTYDASGWGTEGALERNVDFCGLLAAMRLTYAKTEIQKKLLSRRLAHSRREFVRILVHDIVRRRFRSARHVWRQLQHDPFTLAVLFPEITRIVSEKIKPVS
jgi:succinoglycan biosynthesis protein ExoW